ncbi:hypothetical protein BDZ45DRAFT_699811 [Acephala macrosclerotiorum]|nr:hypothetical protein BDZ45DRAFT_699811 [Acephala macrosclerotiorum]
MFAGVAAIPTKKASSTAAATAITRGASTVVMKEVGGIAGNECLIFSQQWYALHRLNRKLLHNHSGQYWFIGKSGEPNTLDFLLLKPSQKANEAFVGEIVGPACVNTAADRQVTPSTSASVAGVLVQRSFDAGFRQDLIGKQACVGFNGTDFKAVDCAASDTQFVSLLGGELKSGTACQSGHDGAAQLTVDTTDSKCVGVTLTTVTPAAP